MSDPIQKPTYFPALPASIIGLFLMLAGMYVSTNAEKIGLTTALKPIETLGLSLDPGKTVAVIGVFLILFPVIRIFFFNPLDEAIHARTTDLHNTFTEAENLREQMTKMKADYEQRLATTEANAREQIQTSIREAQDLRKSLMSEAQAKADDMIRQANEEIAAEKNKTLTELRVHVATLSLQATEKILHENMDNDRNRRLIDEFLTQVEAKN